MPEIPEMKPCPHCNGLPEIYISLDDMTLFMCPKCQSFTGYRLGEQKAIEAWNTRCKHTCQWFIKKGGTIYDVWSCSECGYELDENFCENRTKFNACDFKYCPNCGSKVVD